MKTTKISKHRREQENKAMIEEMRAFAHLMFALLETEGGQSLTWQQVATKCGLSTTTLRNLFYGKTRYPQYLTIQKLGKAAGFSFDAAANQIRKNRKAG